MDNPETWATSGTHDKKLITNKPKKHNRKLKR